MIKTREEVERARKRADRKKETSIIGVGGAIFLVLAAIGIYLFITAQPDKAPPAQPVTANAIMSDSTQCDRLVEISRRDGIVKGERIGNRIRVDESRWAAMTEEGRRNLLQYVACAAFAGRSLDALDEGEDAVAVSATSGKLVAKAGRDGKVLGPGQ
ncbi:MAG TPA: hypothetical protein VF463_21115 [Sphingobium sp.]